jgi:hypothetical protein
MQTSISIFGATIVDAYLRFWWCLYFSKGFVFHIIKFCTLLKIFLFVTVIMILTSSRNYSFLIFTLREYFWLGHAFLFWWFNFRVYSLSHDFRVAWSDWFWNLADFDGILIVIEHFFYFVDAGTIRGKLAQLDGLGAMIERWSVNTLIVAALSAWTIIFELAHSLQHDQVLSNIVKDCFYRFQFAFVVLLFFFLSKFPQSGL